jgi:hypothetical protein
MRLAQPSYSYDGNEIRNADMSARLTLPDGTVKEFGADSIKERTVLKKAGSDSVIQRLFGAEGLEAKEKFLAIGSVEAGSVVEVRTSVTEYYPNLANIRLLQMDAVPVLKLEYRHSPAKEDRYSRRFITLNSKQLQLKEDKNSGLITITGESLPAIKTEPLDGAKSYYAATLVCGYTRRQFISTKGGDKNRLFKPNQPWAPIATLANWEAEDHVVITSKVKKVAAGLAEGADTDVEKARRIHDYVQRLYTKFYRQEKMNRVVLLSATDRVSMDDIIDFEKEKPEQLITSDFLWLAVSLYRAAGLRAEVLMLPNRQVVFFNKSMVSSALLPDRCVAIRIGDAWHFSLPNSKTLMRFDSLPWENQGCGGLLALDAKDEFIDVPLSLSSESRVENSGTLKLDSEGTLSGNCRIVMTGHEAANVRRSLYGRNTERQVAIARGHLNRQFAPAALRDIQITNGEDPYKPLELSFTMHWPGYATLADDRLIFHPFVFRSNEHSPFTAEERHNRVIFPFNREEADTLTITLPEGYELEANVIPESLPGDVLSYKIQIGYSAKRRTLHIKRDFLSNAVAVDVNYYPAVKRWYDAVATHDQHSLILKKSAAPAESLPPASAPVP